MDSETETRANRVNILILFFCPWAESRQLTGWMYKDVWALPSPPLHSNCRHTKYNALYLYVYNLNEMSFACEDINAVHAWWSRLWRWKKQKQRLSRLLTPGKSWQKCALCLIAQLPGPLCFWQCLFLQLSLSSWREKMDVHSVTFHNKKDCCHSCNYRKTTLKAKYK